MNSDLLNPPAPALTERDWQRRRAHLLREIERPSETRDRTSRRSFPRKLAVALALAAVIAAAAAVLPARFGDSQGGLIDRAIAAIGTGRTTHVVLVGVLAHHVDLRTGKRTPQHLRSEIWADPKLGMVEIDAVDGVSMPPLFAPPSQSADELDFLHQFVKSYRAELAAGDYHPVGRATIDGENVEWIARKPYALNDEAGVEHLYVQEVAISRKTFKPLYWRTRVDGVVDPTSLTELIVANSVPPRPALFAHREQQAPLFTDVQSAPATTLQAARAAMNPNPVVPAAKLAGLRRTAIGLPRLLEGPPNHLRQVPGVELFYGKPNFLGLPIDRGSFISITEFPNANAVVRSELPAFQPTGAVVFRNTATLRAHGLYIIVNASTPEKALAAARALAR
jgi:hypothetical protein